MDFFSFKGMKGESQLNVFEIGNYICIASDDINNKPFFLFIFCCRNEKQITVSQISVGIRLKN